MKAVICSTYLEIDQHQLRQLLIMATITESIDEAADAARKAEEEEKPPGWGTDDRIAFSKETGKYLQQNDDGSEMEWHPKLKAWMPVVRTSLPPAEPDLLQSLVKYSFLQSRSTTMN